MRIYLYNSRKILADRKVQIEYIKQTNPDVAKILWQDARPFNLYNHHLAKFPYNFPYRVLNKFKRVFESLLGKKFVQRNWELQFLGKENRQKLASYILSDDFNKEVDRELVKKIMNLFYENDSVYYSHAVSMLLTLSVYFKKIE